MPTLTIEIPDGNLCEGCLIENSDNFYCAVFKQDCEVNHHGDQEKLKDCMEAIKNGQ